MQGQRITVCGVDDPLIGLPAFNKQLEALDGLDSKVYTVLLSHRPEFVNEYEKYNFDLVLTGHTHGGMWRLPFVMNGLYAVGQGWLPHYAGGKYDLGNTTMIIGRGLTKFFKVPRIFNPPELVVVDIEPA